MIDAKPSIVLNGTTYTLSATLADYAEAERRLNTKSMLGGVDFLEFWNKPPTTLVQYALFVGVCRSTTATFEEVCDWITFENWSEVEAATAQILEPIAARFQRIEKELSELVETQRKAAEDETPLAGPSDGDAGKPSPESVSTLPPEISGDSQPENGSTTAQ